MRTGSLTVALRDKIAATIKTSLSPRHVPALIAQVGSIPCTVNGKKVELTVRDIVSGKMPTISSTLANPESLEEFKRFAKSESSAARVKL